MQNIQFVDWVATYSIDQILFKERLAVGRNGDTWVLAMPLMSFLFHWNTFFTATRASDNLALEIQHDGPKPTP